MRASNPEPDPLFMVIHGHPHLHGDNGTHPFFGYSLVDFDGFESEDNYEHIERI